MFYALVWHVNHRRVYSTLDLNLNDCQSQLIFQHQLFRSRVANFDLCGSSVSAPCNTSNSGNWPPLVQAACLAAKGLNRFPRVSKDVVTALAEVPGNSIRQAAREADVKYGQPSKIVAEAHERADDEESVTREPRFLTSQWLKEFKLWHPWDHLLVMLSACPPGLLKKHQYP